MTETKQQMAERMADLIVSIAQDNGGVCMRYHLRQAGFSDEQIDRCEPIATRFASMTLNKDIQIEEGNSDA